MIHILYTGMTICLYPIALIGLGIICAFTWALINAGYCIGKDLLEWIREGYRKCRRKSKPGLLNKVVTRL